jgi:hypothetical protein
LRVEKTVRTVAFVKLSKISPIRLNHRQLNSFIYAQIGNYESINGYIVNKSSHLYSTPQVIYIFTTPQGILFMTTFSRDVLIGLMFIVGIAGFISGEFIISTVLFASAAIFSNVHLNRHFYG